jgi:hypothetical protein
MAIDPDAPETLANQVGLAGGLLEPLTGAELQQPDPGALEFSLLPDSEFDLLSPIKTIPQDEIQLAMSGPISAKLARLIGFDFSGTFGDASKKVDDMVANRGNLDTTGRTDIEGEQLTFEDGMYAPYERGSVLPNLRAEGAIPNLRFEQPKLADEERAGMVIEGVQKEVEISPEGLLDDFRAVGSRGDEKIPDEGRVLSTIQSISSTYAGKIDEAKRGEITTEATRQMADILGMSPNKLAKAILGRSQGQVIQMTGPDGKPLGLAETMLAARDLLVTEIKYLDELAKKAETGTNEDALRFREQLELVAQMQMQIKGSQTEIARALGQFKIPARGGQAGQDIEARTADVNTLLEEFGGADDVRLMARAYNEAGSVADRAAVTRGGSKFKKFNDAFYEAWINILLSNPITHVKNNVGNILIMTAHVGETAMAATMGTARRALGGEGGVHFGEVQAQLFGAMMAIQDAWSASGKAFRTGEAPVLGSKIDGQRGTRPVRAFSAEGFEAQGMAGVAADFLGNVFTLGRIPTRMLEFEDTFYKVVAQRMSLYQQAYRQAHSEGLTGDALSSRIAEFVYDPPASAIKEADAHAKYVTLQTDLDSAGKALNGVRKIPMMRYFLPFFKTPYNAAKYAMVERSPLGMFYGEGARAIKRGKAPGASAADKAAADMARTRIYMGSATMMMVGMMAANGQVTGAGPADPDLRAALRRQGWQPYSIRVGDKYLSYAGAEPFSTIMGLAADAAELGMSSSLDGENWERVLMASSGAIAYNMTNKTFLQGFSNMVATLNDPGRYANGTLESFQRSLVPRVVAQGERLQDPIVRDARSVIDQLKSQVPWLSNSLPARRNFWGQKIMLAPALGPDVLSPIYSSVIGPNPAAAGEKSAQRTFELDQMFVALRWGPGNHPDVFSSEGVKVGLTKEEIEQFHIYAGARSLEYIEKAVANENFQRFFKIWDDEVNKGGSLSPSVQAQQARELAIDMLTTAVTAARAKAREDLYEDEKFGPDIQSAAEEYIGILRERNEQVRDMLQ